MAGRSAQRYPEGIGDSEAEASGRGLRRHASVISVVLLGVILIVALTGLLGGGAPTRHVADAPAASRAVVSPRVLRNGEFFEMRFEVAARQALEKPSLEVDPALWRQLTVNTQLPGAKEESFKNGMLHFDYDRLAAGDRLEVKIDGQVNPPLMAGTAGTVALKDGEREIARVPIRITVLP
jgi:hypothetical protein